MSTLELPGLLVSADWLHQHIDHEQLVIFDGSWHLPTAARDGYEEWKQQHIPGARFFDFDSKICAPGDDLPHMMPSAELFTREMQALGLNQDHIVVVYDAAGLFSAARVWWMLRAMGCNNCAVLDGGMPAWIDAGFNLVAGENVPTDQGNFIAVFDEDAFVGAQTVEESLGQDNIQILDARAEARFRGEAEEPRAGLRKGHMPGAANLPFPELFSDGLMKSESELAAIYKPLLEGKQRALCSCGSGVTACILVLGAMQAGYGNLAVYDGSWSEWGMPGNRPVVTGK